MIRISHYISNFSLLFNGQSDWQPWQVTSSLADIIEEKISCLSTHYYIANHIAIHHTAVVEPSAVLKGPLIIGENCFIGAHAYLRGGVFLSSDVKLGPGCEIKTSIIFNGSAVAHFNFIGDSIIGTDVNFEAGSVIANHYNERTDKLIHIKHNQEIINTGVKKFGALVGDRCRIGANAVLSPGTLLLPHSIVNRLELVQQNPE